MKKNIEQYTTKLLYSKINSNDLNQPLNNQPLSKDIFTGKTMDKMTVEEIENSKNKYDKKIEEKENDILITLRETHSLTNTIGNELNENTESLERINDGIDEINHKMNTAEYLVRRFSEWFSFFKPIRQQKAFVKTTHKNKTKFVESKLNLKSDKVNATQKSDVFYDDVSMYLDELQKNADTFGIILKENAEDVDIIHTKVAKSDGRIKKTIDKVKMTT